LGAATLLGLCVPTHAAVVDVTVTVQNLTPVNSVSFAPLHVGFNNGSFDAFNLGGVATAPIISVAEGGAGGAWQAAFAAADPSATRGTIGGLLLAGCHQQHDVPRGLLAQTWALVPGVGASHLSPARPLQAPTGVDPASARHTNHACTRASCGRRCRTRCQRRAG
jgi:hypothetical protein